MNPVTKTFFPPLDEFNLQLERIWKNQWITNRGELVRELEIKLKNHLKVRNLTLTANGTLPLQIALKLLGDRGEVITTSFSHVATTSAIIWEGCHPVFVDIHPEYLTIDETKIEAAITKNTKAIVATHVFGNPCEVEKINEIAENYGLKVIYDAAHAFGVTYKGEPLFNYGDVSTCSFHATKLFHTAEGGAIFCKDDDLHHKLFYSHNFGHKTFTEFYGAGINAKMSELHAAMGLTVLPYIEDIISKRKNLVDIYDSNLESVEIQKIKLREGTQWNYSYYPIIFKNKEVMFSVEASLNKENIFPRRYFYPSLNKLDYVLGETNPVSESIASRILCLPLYPELEPKVVRKITDTILTII